MFTDAAFTQTSTEFYQWCNFVPQSTSQAPRSNISACGSILQPAPQPSTQPRSSTPPHVHRPLAHLPPLNCFENHDWGVCVWGGISTSLQLPSINAKCWPSNKTLITSCSALHTQQNVQRWHQGCSQLLRRLWEAVITDILCSGPETGLNLCTGALQPCGHLAEVYHYHDGCARSGKNHGFLILLTLQFALIAAYADFYIWGRKLLEITVYYVPVHTHVNYKEGECQPSQEHLGCE